MNQKQLANVLIKVLGLSLFVHALANLISQLLSWLVSLLQSPTGSLNSINHLWTYVLSLAIEAALGVFLIMRSRCVAERLLRNEEQ